MFSRRRYFTEFVSFSHGRSESNLLSNTLVVDAVMGNYQGAYFECKEESHIQLPESP